MKLCCNIRTTYGAVFLLQQKHGIQIILPRFSLFNTAYAAFTCIQGYPLYRDNKRFSIYRLNGQINAVYLLDKFLCNDFLR